MYAYDLQMELVKQSLERDIRFVYRNLLAASKNHLRIFVAILEGNGVKYSPEIISNQEYMDILKQ